MRNLSSIQTEQRCSRCILPRSPSPTGNSEAGICEICVQAERHGLDPLASGAGTGDLEPIIDEIRKRGEGQPFHCLVGLSGGRDSTWLAYLLTKRHNLRCLGAYYRTPFTHATIDANIRRISECLDIPLIEMKVACGTHERVARDFFLLWKQNPRPEFINLACAPCKMLNRNVFRIARKHGIRSIVFGGNPMEEIDFLPTHQNSEGSRHSLESLQTQTLKFLQIVRKGAALAVKCPRALRHLGIAAKASLLYLNPHSTWLQLRYPGILRVDYFLHAPYSEAECLHTIREELGWYLPPGYSETWRADCAYAALRDHMFQETVGSSYIDCMLSNLVRAGQLTREQALARREANVEGARVQIAEAIRILDIPEALVEMPSDTAATIFQMKGPQKPPILAQD
jgi:hypothetical protein